MKLNEFDWNYAHWDQYRRFARQWPGGFTQFDTGEVICHGHYDNQPDSRKFYKELNVTVVGTDDTNCPRFTMDGEPVAKSWLSNNGQQTLLIDHDNGHVVRLYGSGGGLDPTKPRPWALPVPESLRQHARAYWHGPNSDPVGCPVTVNKTRRLTPAERAYIEGIRAECKAWDTLSEQPLRTGKWVNNHWVRGDDGRNALAFDRVMAVKTYLDLTVDERLDLSRHGCTNGTVRHEVPYLMLANWEKTTNENDE